MGGWSGAPLTLKAYVVISLGWSLVGIAAGLFTGDSLVIGAGVFGLAIAVAICFFLLRGSGALWWVALALSILTVLTIPIPPHVAWYNAVPELVLLALLVAPETRRHCGVGRQPSL